MRRRTRRIACLLLGGLWAGWPAVGWADAGDWSLAAVPSLSLDLQRGAPSPGAQLLGQAELGLWDHGNLRLEAGPVWYAAQRHVMADVGVGLVVAWDALRWVPALAVGLGLQVPRGGLRYGMNLELRRFVGLDVALALRLGLQRRAGQTAIVIGGGAYRSF